MVRTHTVVAGETLSALALRFYGDAELYRLIATASGIADPNVINVGQRLIFPDFTRYTVVAGDTLSALAVRFYGDAELDSLIAGASGIADPNSAINAGQRLIIPDISRYTVVAGDTLSALASRFYGDASLYPLIATVNGIADPDVINAGQVLVIFVGRSDGFGLTIVDRNENDPRLKYYRFQTSAIGWNPGVNVLLPADYATSGRTYPVLYLFHGGDQDFRFFDFAGIRDLTAGKPIIVVMPDGGHAGWYSNPVSSFVGPRNWETFHIAQLLPWIEANFRTYAEYDGRAVSGFSMGGLGERPLRPGESAPRFRPGRALGEHHLGGPGPGRRHGLRRAVLGPGPGQRRQPGRAYRQLPEQADLPGRRHQSGPAQLVRQRERDPGACRPAGVPRTPQRRRHPA
jgi:LysM repeat protein